MEPQEPEVTTEAAETPDTNVVEIESTDNSAEELQAEPAEVVTPFSWQASEYVHHQKGPAWYIGLFSVLAVLTALAVLTKEWLAIAVFICMFVALVVYGSRSPRTLTYTLDEEGMHIENRTYPYDSFRSFAVLRDLAWHTIDLEPTQRFMPRLTILFDDKDMDEIVNRLSGQLPRVDRDPDWIERVARYLHF